MSEKYIWIPNWRGDGGFQHYTGRDPIWIKNYTRLLHKDEYLGLSTHRRGLLHGIWLAYATSARRLRHDPRTISSRLNAKVTTADMESLNHAGFIEVVASKTLARRLQDASPEVEREKRREELEKEPVAVDVVALPVNSVRETILKALGDADAA